MNTDQLNTFYEKATNRWPFWQAIANKYGDFRIMKSWFIDGDARFAKWQSIVDASSLESQYHLEFSHRQILPFEICLDMDDLDKMDEAYALFDRFIEEGVLKEVYLFETGSKGIHIHIFLLDEYMQIMPNVKKWRRVIDETKKLLSYWGFDTQKSSIKVPIALEFAPHWKSGKQKKLIKGRGEFYERNWILE